MAAPDPARTTAGERAWYERGLADGKATVAPVTVVAAPEKHSWFSSEFVLIAVVLAFGMWAGAVAILDKDIDIDRWVLVVGTVSALAWGYGNQRAAVKKEAAATAADVAATVARKRGIGNG